MGKYNEDISSRKRTGRRKKRGRPKWRAVFILAIAAVCAIGIAFLWISRRSSSSEDYSPVEGVAYADTIAHDENFWSGSPDITAELLTPNRYSRPQIVLTEINGIVIHYTADPGATAQNIRDYFESLGTSGDRSASSHFVVGLDGEIIQMIPCSEWAYASNSRNSDTLSIECCHPDATGVFNDATYQSAVNLTAWLCKAFKVDPDNVIRHYDVTGKICPKWFVDDESAWTDFRANVKSRYDKIT